MLTNGNIVLASAVVLERAKTDGHAVSTRVIMKTHIIPSATLPLPNT